jgi:selenocysteine lyase/cysteine desulfurase
VEFGGGTIGKISRQKWVQLKKNPASTEIGKPGYNEPDELARSRRDLIHTSA